MKLKHGKVLVSACLIACMIPMTSLQGYCASRLGARDRYGTAVEISKNGWQTSKYAIIATGEDFPDALCAAPLAKKYDAPIILTDKASLNADAKQELQRLEVQNVIIVGGDGVVSSNTEKQIKDLKINTTRISGKNRFETSEKVAEQIGASSNVVIATGMDFPDALSIAPIAAKGGMPILLTQKDSIPDEIKPYLNNNFTNTYVIGGTGVISDQQANQFKKPTRLSGKDRYLTNVAVLNNFNDIDYSNVCLATGTDFPDALTGSALASKLSTGIVLYDKYAGQDTMNLLKGKITSNSNVRILGGTGVISESDMNSVASNIRQVGKQADLGAGNFVVGKDIPAGIYDATAVSGSGNFIVTSSDVSEDYTNEILKSSGSFGVKVVRTKLSDGDKIEIDYINKVHFEPVTTPYVVAKQNLKLYSGSWFAGKDIVPGRYKATVPSGSGNFFVEGKDNMPTVNEILSTDSNMGVKEVTFDIADGQHIWISGLEEVDITPAN